MKKMIMSAIMCVALIASTSVMAQDSTKKEGCCSKTKTECKKDEKKKTCKEGEKKSCCTKDKSDKK